MRSLPQLLCLVLVTVVSIGQIKADKPNQELVDTAYRELKAVNCKAFPVYAITPGQALLSVVKEEEDTKDKWRLKWDDHIAGWINQQIGWCQSCSINVFESMVIANVGESDITAGRITLRSGEYAVVTEGLFQKTTPRKLSNNASSDRSDLSRTNVAPVLAPPTQAETRRPSTIQTLTSLNDQSNPLNNRSNRSVRAADTRCIKLEAHPDGVNTVSFAPDGRTLASGGEDGSVKLWRLPDGQLLQNLEGHTLAVTDVRWSSGGSSIVSASLDGTVRFWNAATGECLGTTQVGNPGIMQAGGVLLDDQVLCLDRDGSGHLWVAGTLMGEVAWWKPGKELARQKLADNAITNLTLLQGGQLLICEEFPGSITYWRLTGDKWETAPSNPFPQIAIDWEQGSILTQPKAFAGHGANLGQWLISCEPEPVVVPDGIQRLSLSKWPQLTPQEYLPIVEPTATEALNALDINSDDRFIAGAGTQGSIYLWQVDWLPQYLTQLSPQQATQRGFPGGKLFLAAQADNQSDNGHPNDAVPSSSTITSTTSAKAPTTAPTKAATKEPSRSSRSHSPKPPASAPKIEGWPELLDHPGDGQNALTLVSRGDNAIVVGLRLRRDGQPTMVGYDIRLAPGASVPVTLTDGTWMVYIRFEAEPAAIYQGDNVTIGGGQHGSLTFNTTTGNYGMKRIK